MRGLVPRQERKLYCVVGYLLLLTAWFAIAHLSGVLLLDRREMVLCCCVLVREC